MIDTETLVLALLQIMEQAKDPQQAEQAAQALIDEMEPKKKAFSKWQPYQGVRGGKGFINDQGTVVYGDTMPGSDDDAPYPIATPAADDDIPTARQATNISGTIKRQTPEERANAESRQDEEKTVGIKGIIELPKDDAGKLAAKQAAVKRLGKAAFEKLPPIVQKSLTVTVNAGKKLEHKLEGAYKTGQAIAREAARERGASEEQVEKVGKILGAADFIARWSANVPAAHAGIELLAACGGPVTIIGAKASFYIPVASLAYITYSAARNPFKTIRAARRAISLAKHDDIPTATAKTITSTDDTFARQLGRHSKRTNYAPELLDRFDQAEDTEWLQALLAAALDETQDLGKAIKLVDQVNQTQHFDWSAYKGPKGGKGWQNDKGDVIYGGDKPGGEQHSTPNRDTAIIASIKIRQREQRHAEGMQDRLAAAWEGATAIPGNAPSDVELETPDAREQVEMKTLLVNKRGTVRMTRAAMTRKLLRLEDHPPPHTRLWTVAYDHRDLYKSKKLGKATPFPLYIREGGGNFAISSMHLVQNQEELDALMKLPREMLPTRAKAPIKGFFADWMAANKKIRLKLAKAAFEAEAKKNEKRRWL